MKKQSEIGFVTIYPVEVPVREHKKVDVMEAKDRTLERLLNIEYLKK